MKWVTQDIIVHGGHRPYCQSGHGWMRHRARTLPQGHTGTGPIAKSGHDGNTVAPDVSNTHNTSSNSTNSFIDHGAACWPRDDSRAPSLDWGRRGVPEHMARHKPNRLVPAGARVWQSPRPYLVVGGAIACRSPPQGSKGPQHNIKLFDIFALLSRSKILNVKSFSFSYKQC